MKEKPDDPRVERTLDAIDRTFRTMMLEGGLKSITVRELCARARVNKNTFYRYYHSIEDLVAEVMAGYSDTWREHSAGHSRVTDVAAATRELFFFGDEQDDLYNAITCDPSWSVIQRRLQKDASGEFEQEPPDNFSPAQWGLFYAFVSQSGLAMYRAWIASGKSIPVEEAAVLAAHAVEAGAKSLMRDMGIGTGPAGRRSNGRLHWLA